MEQKTLAAQLRKDLARNDLTMEQLVDEAQRLLTVLAPRQTRYKVRERPDVRTIRYYVSKGLLPKPVSYEGGRARYSGSHLLRLLLIKQMQSEHHTLQRVGEVLATLGDLEVLETLVPDAPHAAVTAGPKPVPSAPERGREISNLRRIPLAFDANLDIPESLFQDPQRRQALAEDLKAFARFLAGNAPNVSDNGEGDES